MSEWLCSVFYSNQEISHAGGSAIATGLWSRQEYLDMRHVDSAR